GFFAQDEWKLSRKLTLTYGLRYDFETYPNKYLQRNDLNNFQPRLGLVYAVTPRTVLRAGLGIFNDRRASSVAQVLVSSDPLSPGDRPNASVLFPGISTLPGH